MVKKLIVILGCLMVMLVIIGCDEDMATTHYEFVQLPYRIAYVANVDTRLDLAGTTMRGVGRDGTRKAEFLLIDALQPSGFQNIYTQVRHSIDFRTPGVYKVEVVLVRHDNRFYVPFFIQVIDEETFNQLSAGEWQPQAAETHE